MEKSLAQIVMEELSAHKVDTVFGFPGGAVLNLYDALYEYKDKIHHIQISDGVTAFTT